MSPSADRQTTTSLPPPPSTTGGADQSPPHALPRWEGSTDRPLPPLPDGGLAAVMPDWLRVSADPDIPHSAAVDHPLGESPSPTAEYPTPKMVDPTTFIEEDDLPAWIHQLAGQQPISRGERGRQDEPLPTDTIAPRRSAVTLPMTETVITRSPAGVIDAVSSLPPIASHRPAPSTSPQTPPGRVWLPVALAALLVLIALLAVLLGGGALR